MSTWIFEIHYTPKAESALWNTQDRRTSNMIRILLVGTGFFN